MSRGIHRRDTPDGPRYRLWSTIVDCYVTSELTREEMKAELLFLSGEQAENYVAERLARTDEQGTSFFGESRDASGPWDTERRDEPPAQ